MLLLVCYQLTPALHIHMDGGETCDVWLVQFSTVYQLEAGVSIYCPVNTTQCLSVTGCQHKQSDRFIRVVVSQYQHYCKFTVLSSKAIVVYILGMCYKIITMV